MRRYNKNPERAFEAELAHVAAVNKCAYYKIPDPIITKKKTQDRKNYIFTEQKRPFDGILVTPQGNYCVECKYNYTQLSQHQKDNLYHINSINGTGIVLRKIEKIDKTGYRREYVKYRIEVDGETIHETDNPSDMIKHIINNNRENNNETASHNT